jgi:hypothetical protein
VTIALAVDRTRDPDQCDAHVLVLASERRLQVPDPGRDRARGNEFVALSGDAARGGQGRPGDQQRPVGAGEGRCEDRDRLAVGLGATDLAELVLVGEVDDAIAVSGARAQDVDVGQVPAQHLGTRRCDGVGGSIGTGETDDLVSGADELRNHGRADPAGRAGDEDVHEGLLGSSSWSIEDGLVETRLRYLR